MKKCFERIRTVFIIIALVLAIFCSETIKMQSFANAEYNAFEERKATADIPKYVAGA